MFRMFGAQRESAGHSGHIFTTAPRRRAVGDTHFDSPAVMIYRFIVAQPWPERLADPGMRTVARALSVQS